METIDSKAWSGVQSLLDSYIKTSADDYVVLLYTSDSAESAAWVSAALDLRGIHYKRVWMAPIWDKGFVARLTPALPNPAKLSGRLVVLSFERDTMSHTQPLVNAIAEYKNKLVFRTISACPSPLPRANSSRPVRRTLYRIERVATSVAMVSAEVKRTSQGVKLNDTHPKNTTMGGMAAK